MWCVQCSVLIFRDIFFLQKSAFRLIAYFVPRSNREPNSKDPCCYFYIKSNVCLTDQSFVHIIECLDHIPVCTPVSTDCKHWPLIRQITGIGAHKLCRIQIHGVLSNQENTEMRLIVNGDDYWWKVFARALSSRSLPIKEFSSKWLKLLGDNASMNDDD